MCNRYGYLHPYHELVEEFSQTRISLRFPPPTAAPNLPPLPEIRPTDAAPLIRAHEDGTRFDTVRWGFPPPRPKGGPVINFRSEGRRFASGRCLIPASYFFEFTGSTYPKTRWRFALLDGAMFCIAGLWRESDGVSAFTMLTVDPGPDVTPYHDRQVVVLGRDQWADWLVGDQPERVLAPAPAGFLQVTKDEPGGVGASASRLL